MAFLDTQLASKTAAAPPELEQLVYSCIRSHTLSNWYYALCFNNVHPQHALLLLFFI